MRIRPKKIRITELVNGFMIGENNSVYGYGGKLNIRPPFQRELVYNEKEQQEVINSVFKGYPLNVMYWAKSDKGYELLDGQQRTLSICNFFSNFYTVVLNGSIKNFYSLSAEEKSRFLDYELQIYICEDGSQDEIIDWFRVINIAGKKLNKQELRNAVYTGPWITLLKAMFASNSCVGKQFGEKYLSGSPIRQDYVETVLDWISDGKIEEYMAEHRNDTDAEKEWMYFYDVINWVSKLFTTYRKEMKGLPWGRYYNLYHENFYSPAKLEEQIQKLMIDDDVTNKKGVYAYLLSGEERHLSVRAFSDSMKREAYERQGGVCPCCRKRFDIDQMEGDHITPWSQGGKTTADNCQMLCKSCNRTKSSK